MSDFSVSHGEALRELLILVLAMLPKTGLITLNCVAVDGTKIHTGAGRKSSARTMTGVGIWWRPVHTFENSNAKTTSKPPNDSRRRSNVPPANANSAVVGPDQFIPFAEDTGLIFAVDRFTLTEVCRQLREWRGSFPRASSPYVSVNLSAYNLRKRDIVPEIKAILAEFDVPPEVLVLELTESAYVECAESVIGTLQELQRHGIRIFIDDFGVGYASLSYLSRLPIDAVKIDQSLVRQTSISGEGLEVVRAITALARTLGFRVVAEGIETEEQVGLVRSLHCDYGQGYFYGRSVDVDKATNLISARTRGRLEENDPDGQLMLHHAARSFGA